MRIVIEIDENQSGTTQSLSATPRISTESTPSYSSMIESATTAPSYSGKGVNAGAAPASGFTQMDPTMPFISLPTAIVAAAETSMNDSSAGGALGGIQETYFTESSAESEEKE